MIPMIWLLARALGATKRSEGGGIGGFVPWRGPEADGWFVVALFVRLGAIGYVAAEPASLLSIPLLAIAVPGLLIDGALVPLGLARTAYWWSRAFCPVRSWSDPLAGAVVDSVRALRVRPRHGSERADDLSFRLCHRGGITSSWALVAWAELADLRGQKSGARLLMAAARRRGGALSRARRRAARWLLADASERGAWHEALLLARKSPPLHEAKLVAACLRIGAGAPQRTGAVRSALARAAIVARWALTPHRRATWGWVRHAPRRRAAIESPPAGASDSLLAKALDAHRHAMALGAFGGWREIEAAASAWDRVACPETDAALGRRIAALAARIAPAEARATVLTRAQDDLAALVRLASESRRDDPPAVTLAIARAKIVEERSAVYAALVAATPSRAWSHPAPPTTDSWAAWSAIRGAFEDLAAVSTQSERASALLGTWGALCNHGAWLANECHERQLAHDVFAWLRDACRALRVPAEMKLLERNARATR